MPKESVGPVIKPKIHSIAGMAALAPTCSGCPFFSHLLQVLSSLVRTPLQLQWIVVSRPLSSRRLSKVCRNTADSRDINQLIVAMKTVSAFSPKRSAMVSKFSSDIVVILWGKTIWCVPADDCHVAHFRANKLESFPDVFRSIVWCTLHLCDLCLSNPSPFVFQTF